MDDELFVEELEDGRDTRDPEQAHYFAELERRRAAREHELWRWVLTQKMGREFLHTVVFGTLGYMHHIPTVGSDQTFGAIALHNLACRWLGKFVVRHRELYLQMVNEATKRDDDEREALETQRAAWAAARREQ